ncbi:tRNA (guanine-N(1)-)-methyltransferase [Trichinella spiralis]|uniref:tRNA (Guanine-N(1)-)-methyltransferase n=1 Tax=Trichinella spiralis TaxID=6334 RepID=A0ABR3KTV0_TRISP
MSTWGYSFPFSALGCPSSRSSWVDSVLFLLALYPAQTAPMGVSRRRGCSVFHSHSANVCYCKAGKFANVDETIRIADVYKCLRMLMFALHLILVSHRTKNKNDNAATVNK